MTDSTMTEIPLVAKLLRVETSKNDLAGMTYFGADAWLVNPDGPEAAAMLKAAVEALEKQGLALAAWVNLLTPETVNADGEEILTDQSHWLRDPTKAEVQAALEAQNEADNTLASLKQPGGR